MIRQPLRSPSPKKIVVIAMRYLGDVQLITPLVRSIRIAYPKARLDVLVFQNTAAMLEGNPDIDRIITTPNRPKFADLIKLFPQLFRRYDLAIATQSGDRPFLYSLLASPFRIAVVPVKNSTGWWKRFFMQGWIEHDDVGTHTVLQNLRLADLLGIKRHYVLVPPRINSNKALEQRFDFLADTENYAVLHMHPQWIYKRWTREGWIEIGHYLNKLGLRLILSGGPGQEELDYVADIAAALPKNTLNIAGAVSLAELSEIISRAKLFLGPDTGITHMAAATGVPVLAFYGPTNPVKWAPWPKGFEQDKNPFEKKGSRRINNVSLLQGTGDCVPCGLEGCERHRQSRSQCLDNLSVDHVKEAISESLKSIC